MTATVLDREDVAGDGRPGRVQLSDRQSAEPIATTSVRSSGQLLRCHLPVIGPSAPRARLAGPRSACPGNVGGKVAEMVGSEIEIGALQERSLLT